MNSEQFRERMKDIAMQLVVSMEVEKPKGFISTAKKLARQGQRAMKEYGIR